MLAWIEHIILSCHSSRFACNQLTRSFLSLKQMCQVKMSWNSVFWVFLKVDVESVFLDCLGTRNDATVSRVFLAFSAPACQQVYFSVVRTNPIPKVLLDCTLLIFCKRISLQEPHHFVSITESRQEGWRRKTKVENLTTFHPATPIRRIFHIL